MPISEAKRKANKEYYRAHRKEVLKSKRKMTTEELLIAELNDAERKAWDSLSRYKFHMFGYWAAVWVHLNRISGEHRPNPWAELVQIAREVR